MPTYSIRKIVRMPKFSKLSADKAKSVSQLKNFDYICIPFPREMQQATLAQSVEQRIRNAQVVSSSLMSGSAKAGSSNWNFPLLLSQPFHRVRKTGFCPQVPSLSRYRVRKARVSPPSPVFKPLPGAKGFIPHPLTFKKNPCGARTALPRSHLVHRTSPSGTKLIQLLDHPAVKVTEKEDFTIGAKAEG